jgi:hypothetical protein
LFSKIQDGGHFLFLNISATMRPREKNFKQKVFQSRQDRNCFKEIQDGDHFRFLSISVNMRPRGKLLKKCFK